MNNNDYPRNLQLWPGGASVSVKGEAEALRVRFQNDKRWRKPTEEERRQIDIEERARMYAERDILCCDSCLVDELLKLGYEGHGDLAEAFSLDNVTNRVVDSSDWTIEQCKDWLEDKGIGLPGPCFWEYTRDEILEALGEDDEDNGGVDTEDLRKKLLREVNEETVDGLDEWREAVRENAYEYEAEIYEWWRVTSWLGKQLDEIGECVLDNDYGCWWGRCCTGQQFIMDGTLQAAAANQNIT